jgi:hypothetical protein
MKIITCSMSIWIAGYQAIAMLDSCSLLSLDSLMNLLSFFGALCHVLFRCAIDPLLHVELFFGVKWPLLYSTLNAKLCSVFLLRNCVLLEMFLNF